MRQFSKGGHPERDELDAPAEVVIAPGIATIKNVRWTARGVTNFARLAKATPRSTPAYL